MASIFAAAHLPVGKFFTILIKKGRGIWPDEALATTTQCAKGANSIIPVNGVRDK